MAVSGRLLICCVALAALGGCVYFNSVYNANQLYDRGRSEIEGGNRASGRASLQQAIEKAEKIVRDKPDSRWADDAQRLIAEARVLLEEWEEAREASRALMKMVKTAGDSAEAAGLLGVAEAHLGEHQRADSLITWGLRAEDDTRWRARLHYARGLARASSDLVDPALSDFAEASRLRPSWTTPRLQRAGLLAAAGRTGEATDELTRIFGTDVDPNAEEEVFVAVQQLAEADVDEARRALEDVENTRLSRHLRARLVKLRADMSRVAGRIATAEADYRLTREIASDSRSAAEAYLELARIRLADVSTMDGLREARRVLEEGRRLPFGGRAPDIQRLYDTIRRLEFYVERGNLGYLAAAEDAREVLGAPGLARTLYLRYVDEEPEGLWAPKAILAVLDLMSQNSVGTNGDHPAPADLRRRLLEDYENSAYVQALLGESEPEGFSFQELEEGLRVQLDRLRVQADAVLRDPRRS